MHIAYVINVLSFIYSSVYRRNIKRKYLLCGLVQDHHIIPREFKNILNYETSNLISSIDSSKNLIIMPTKYGKLFIKTNRSVHENGHKYYNRYIYNLIKENYTIDEIIMFVKQQLRNGIVPKII